jgi:hypothetical protein
MKGQRRTWTKFFDHVPREILYNVKPGMIKGVVKLRIIKELLELLNGSDKGGFWLFVRFHKEVNNGHTCLLRSHVAIGLW